MQKLKKPDENALSFDANGKKYFIENSLSFARYKMYQKLQVECGYDVSFYGMYEGLNKLFDLLNANKLAEAAVLTHNLRTGIENLDKREIPVLEMCALFINTDDEDRGVIDQDMVDKKIKDWSVEGIAVDYFFTIAAATMKDYTRVLNERSLHSSQKEEAPVAKDQKNTLNSDSKE